MRDWQIKRQYSLAKLTLVTHILAYLITIFILINSASTIKLTINTATVLSLLLPAVLFILLDYYFLKRKYERHTYFSWNIVKHTALFAIITVVFVYFQGQRMWLFASIYLLPVILSSITLGKKWGMSFAGAAVWSVYWFSGRADFAGNQAGETFGTILILGGILFLPAWFLSGIMEIEKKTAEHLYALAADEQHRYRELFDFAPVGYLITGEKEIIREANFAAERLLGVDRNIMAGKSLEVFVAPEYRAVFHEAVAHVRRDGVSGRRELAVDINPRYGAAYPAMLTVEPEIDIGGNVTGLRWLLQDMSVHRRAELALREKELAERMRQERDLIARMLDTSPAGIMVLDHRRHIVYDNARIKQILGLRRSELQRLFSRAKSGLPENAPYCPVEVFHKVLAAGQPVYNYPGTICRSGGKTAYLSISGAPIFNPSGGIEQVVLTVDDVTRQKKMTEEMLKADKLESLALLAGGIAHDFNNFMAVMLGNVSLAKMRNKDHKIADNLEHIEKAVLQARELTRKLFIFSRGGSPIRKTLTLEKLLCDTAGFVLSGSAATCDIRVAEELWPVEADEAQIVQVLNNIFINAVQAMPDGGKIKLTAENITVGNAGGASHESALPLPAGRYVCITVTDSGIGIPAEHLGKIFDPFFSTKPKGSGLGLATAYTIIQSHGGLIRVESEPGIGTTFYIYLPASKEPRPEPREDSEELYMGDARILVMDDEEMVLKSCGEMLQYLGCRVTFARDGTEAVSLYEEAIKAGAGAAYDAVIMDLTIPGGAGGLETLEQLRRLDPSVKAIVSSGYSDAPVITHYKDYGFSGFVNKPYRLKELSAALKEVFKQKVHAG